MWTAILVTALGGLLVWVAQLSKLKAEAEAERDEYRRREKARENARKGHVALDNPDVVGELQEYRDRRGRLLRPVHPDPEGGGERSGDPEE